MNSYTAYGLAIQSEIELPELSEAASGVVRAALSHALIRRGRVERSRPPGTDPAAHVLATPDTVSLEYEDAGAYLVRGGSEIVVEALPDADPRVVRLYLLGPVLAILLHQRGFLVLHSSAARIGNSAAAFLGDKGAGKSTMAAALHSRGHPLVADDVVAVDVFGPEPLAYPGFPQLKLFPESAAQLGGGASSLPRIHPEFEKRARRATGGFAHEALPLRAVFELIDADREAIEAVPPQHAFMTLVRHSYVLPLLAATGSAEAHFRQVVGVAAKVPVRRLLRQRSMEALPSVAQLVEDAVARGK